MSKEEFLQRLKQALNGEVPQNIVQENLRFYEEYIGGEVNKGRSEADITAEIGDPRLIAKTIMEAAGEGGETGEPSGYSSYGGQTCEREDSTPQKGVHYFDLSKWYWKALLIGIVVVVIILVISLITGIFSLLIQLFWPVCMVMLVMWMIRGFRR